MAKVPLNTRRNLRKSCYLYTTSQPYLGTQRSTSSVTNEGVYSRNAPPQTTFDKFDREFDDILRLNGYPKNAIDQSKRPQNRPRDTQSQKAEWLYLKIPCGNFYNGSTTRFPHDRVKEHLTNDNSSVKKHLITCHHNTQNTEAKMNKGKTTPLICDCTKCSTWDYTNRNWTALRNVLNLT